MNELEYEFEVCEPEFPEALVSTPQILVFSIDLNTIKVVVYFMANKAVTIAEGIAKSKLGKIALSCKQESSSGAYTASVRLCKVIYTFSNAQGISSNFLFEG